MENLLNKGYDFYCKGMRYYENNEVEGSLINFLLALNTLEIVKEYNSSPVKSKSSSTMWKPAENTCNLGLEGIANIQEAIDTLTRRIAPLQEQLVRIKTARSDKSDEEGPECKNLKAFRFKKEDMITFDNIIGQHVTKQQIKLGLLEPMLHPRLFPQMTKGILLYGPPGTGKTLFAKALINELTRRSNALAMWLYAPTGGELKGKYVGETEKKISAYFKCASKRASDCEATKKGTGQSISVLFIDEIEAIAGNRTEDQSGMMTNSVNTLLQEIDGVGSNKNVIIMAATNYPWKLDEAILRRFDTKILVALPEAEDCVEQIKSEIVKKYFDKIFKETLSAEDAAEDLKNEADADIKFHTDVCPPDLSNNLNLTLTFDYVKKYEILKAAYFPDLDLDAFGLKLHEKGYSGGDISNITKKVFKIMGSDALLFHLKADWNQENLKEPVRTLYNNNNKYYMLNQESTKKSLDISQMLLQLDGKEYCDLKYLDEYIKLKFKTSSKTGEQKRLANILQQTIGHYIAAGEWYTSAHEKKYVSTADIPQGHGDNNTKITLLIKQKPFTDIGDYLFENPKEFYIELEVTFVGGWNGWFNRFLSVNPVSYGNTSFKEGELKYLKNKQFDATARYTSEVFLNLYIINDEESIVIDCEKETRGGVKRVLDPLLKDTVNYMNRKDWDFLLSGKLVDGEGTPNNRAIDKASREAEDEFFTLEDIIVGVEDFRAYELSELPVIGTFQNSQFVKTDLSLQVAKTVESDISSDMWKTMVNFKFSINDFYEAINVNASDSIQPTASKNIIKMLNQYNAQGSLSKTDIAQIENPKTAEPK